MTGAPSRPYRTEDMEARERTEIPTISLTGLRSDDRADLERIGREIGEAARGLGFFSVADHGIPAALVDAVFAQSQRFFALPEAEKTRLTVANSTGYLGYVRIGEEKLDPALAADIKECFNAGPEFASDPTDAALGSPFHCPNQWPDIPSFRSTLIAFHRAALELVVLLHRAIAVDLGIDERFFDRYFTEAIGILRLLHYPPHPGLFDGSVYGAGAHTDYGNLTLLAQDATGGLEVRRRDGTWTEVPPQAGTFVCNIGDCLMRWTNDVYVSNAHRVVNRSGRERFSVAYFGDPNADARVECIPSLLAPEETAKYAPISYAEYLRSRYEATYAVAPAS
ncbi:MAG TPA: 2-oxoglutarate and iron-dependent oxygenase domain-containing protein [Candidatus Acidoferrales bacterium]|nr:2-oxoglutarate and iron-dependent oxygenase domain-containing protein [Candidatus Acidoferrales bacterium]